jgi:MPBQ/MSBQ methyltransferase
MRDPHSIALYDQRILDPVLRGAYGRCGYFNVGDWGDGAQTFEAACNALIARVVVSHPAPLSGEVLDVGCGLGDSTARIAALAPTARVRGINISPAQLDICRARWPALEFIEADAARLEPGPVDHIVSIEAAFHFDTRRAFLERAAAALRPGGTIRLADALFPPDWAGAWTVPTGNRIERPQDYGTMLADLGYRHIRIEDVTERSWRPWARALARTLARAAAAGQAAPDHALWNAILPELETMTMMYLIVSAEIGRDGISKGE